MPDSAGLEALFVRLYFDRHIIARLAIDLRGRGPAMPLTVEAIYENGVLKPAGPLPLQEHEKVRITIIEPPLNWVQETYGILGWKGDPEELRRLAMHPV